MSGKKNINPTDAELDILRVMWSHGPGTVKEIHERLPEKPARGYTTVLKLLQIMSEKGLVARDESRRAHVYRACYTLEYTQRKLLSRLMDRAFDNSASKLVMQALSSKPASRKELREIRKLIDELEEGKK
jgi:BlaI family penicillinase repressor